MIKQKFNLHMILNILTREQLVTKCKLLGLQGYSKMKKLDLAKGVARYMLEEEVFKYRISCLSDEALAFFEKVIEKEGILYSNFTEAECMYADEISRMSFGAYINREQFVIPDDVAQAYTEFRKNKEFEARRKEISWFIKCYRMCGALYGIIPEDVLLKVYEQGISASYGKSTVNVYSLLIPQDIVEFHCWEADTAVGNHDKDTFLYTNVLRNDEYINVYKEQGIKNFYIPTYEEINEYNSYGYLPSIPEYSELKDFLVTRLGLSVSKMGQVMFHTWNAIACGAMPGEVVQENTEFIGAEKVSSPNMRLLLNLTINAYNNTRMIYNRGYTPNELSDMARMPGKKLAFGLKGEAFGGGDDFSSFAAKAKGLTKIGRNDPCPCGSGKKFKKCCGRNL